MYRPRKIQVCSTATALKASNRRFLIIRKEKDDKTINMIHIKSLTAETGEELGAGSHLSINKKVKYSSIGLTDDAAKELYVCLHHYLKNSINIPNTQ
jgi:hypothetical protein